MRGKCLGFRIIQPVMGKKHISRLITKQREFISAGKANIRRSASASATPCEKPPSITSIKSSMRFSRTLEAHF